MRYPNQKFGVFAAGRDSYTKYAALFDPIINAYHQTDCTKRFKGQSMQEVLDSGACAYTRVQGNEWDFVDQSFVEKVKVEAVRNVDKLPTLAGMDAQNLTTLT